MDLWKSIPVEAARWKRALANYPKVVKAATKSDGKTPRATKFGKFVTTDRAWRESLPSQLAERGYITHAELLQVEAWKLGNRGKMRPLYGMVQSNSPASVEKASREALKLVGSDGDLEECCNALCVLRGIGVATSSAVLAAADPRFPFMR